MVFELFPSPVGEELEKLPFKGLKHHSDIEYFDGPLVSEFRDKDNNPYIYYWCDTDQVKYNRWIVFPVSEEELKDFKSEKGEKEQPKRAEIVKSKTCFYFEDLDTNGETIKVIKVFVKASIEEIQPLAQRILADNGRDLFSFAGNYEAERMVGQTLIAAVTNHEKGRGAYSFKELAPDSCLHGVNNSEGYQICLDRDWFLEERLDDKILIYPTKKLIEDLKRQIANG